MNLYLQGEEAPHQFNHANVIEWISNLKKTNINITDAGLIFKPINNITYKIEGITSTSYNNFYYTLYNSKKGSLVDGLIFESEKMPSPEEDIPIAAFEITKNDGSQQGNMYDQRCAKQVPIIEKYGNIPYLFLIAATKFTIVETENSFRQSHNCSIATIIAIGGDVCISKNDKIGYTKYNPSFVYDSIENIEKQENKKKKNGGVPSRVNLKDNKVYIQANLYKFNKKTQKEESHDPNIGYISGRAFLIRKYDDNIEICIVEHKKNFYYFQNKDNKFTNILKLVGVTILFENGIKLKIERENKFNKIYWNYAEGIEKIATIRLEQMIKDNKDYEVLFSNHGGCEKSDTFINGISSQTKRTSGLPDLVFYQKLQNKLYVIEGEKSENYKKGILQMNKKEYDEFIDREFLTKLPPNVKIIKKICTYGSFNNEKDVIYNITKEGVINSFL